VLGVLPGLVGVIQATEVLKLLLGIGDPLVGRLLLADARRMRFQTVGIRRDPMCIACGTRTLTTLQDYDAFCGVPSPTRVVRQLEPSQLAARLRGADPPAVIDVREPWEWGIAHLPGARLLPLGDLEELLPTLDPARETVVYCHHGMRSQAAAERLAAAGFARVWNLAGGIDRWREEVDPAMRRY
jgi:adenylyltransferase/sulfurtransferase